MTGAGSESYGSGAVEKLILPNYVSINCYDLRWVIDLDERNFKFFYFLVSMKLPSAPESISAVRWKILDKCRIWTGIFMVLNIW